MTDKLQVAVVGAGLLGARHARVFAEQPSTSLVAVVDVVADRAKAVANKYQAKAYSSIDELFANEKFDALAIATPDHLHAEPALKAIAASKHVFLEKPIATTLVDAQRISEATLNSKSTVAINFSQRWLADYAWIKRAVASGDLGTLRMATSIKFDTIYVPTGMLSWAAQSSPFYFMSSHDIDLVCWYLAQKPMHVYATETRGVLDAMSVHTSDGMNVLVQFEGGASVNFHSSWIHPTTYPVVADGAMQLIGDYGTIAYNNRLRRIEFHNQKGAQEVQFTGPATATEVSGKLEGAFVESVREFVNCVRDGREPTTSPRHTLVTSQIQDAAMRSLKSGLPEKII